MSEMLSNADSDTRASTAPTAQTPQFGEVPELHASMITEKRPLEEQVHTRLSSMLTTLFSFFLYNLKVNKTFMYLNIVLS